VSARRQLTDKELQVYEDFDNNLIPHDNTYIHAFACSIKNPKVAAKILHTAHPDLAVDIAYEILKLHRQDMTPKEVNKKWEESPTHIPEHAHFVKRKESARQEKRP